MNPDQAGAVESYLARLPADQQAALRRLRETLIRLLPDHVEVISYAMPGLRQPGLNGKMVIGYAAYPRHLGLYPHSGSVIPLINCAPFKSTKSGILFTPANPLPDGLVASIIRTRQAELAAGLGR